MTAVRWPFIDFEDYQEDQLIDMLNWREDEHDLVKHTRFNYSLRWYDPNIELEDLLPRTGRPDRDDEWHMTEAVWNTVEWDLPIYYRRETDQDDNTVFTKYSHSAETGLSPKPTWAQIVRWIEEYALRHAPGESWAERNDAADIYTRQAKDDFLCKPVPSKLTEAGIHLGTGLDHAPAMIYNAHYSTLAGTEHARSVLQDGSGVTIDIWTQADAHALLSGQAELVNHAESARNIIELKLRALLADRSDPTGGLPETATDEEIHQARIGALRRLTAYIQPANLDRELLRIITDLQNGTHIPDDLDKYKELLIERLEGRAMARTKYVMKAATQQGIDRGFSCDDEEDAVKSVARECVLGTRAIELAADDIWKKTAGAWAKVTAAADLPETEEHEGDDPPDASLGTDGEFYRQLTGIAEAKAAFDAAVTRIDAVEAANVPVWKIDGTAWTPGTIGQVNGRSATLLAEQPTATPPIPGPVAMKDTGKAVDDDGNPVTDISVRIRKPTGSEFFQEAYVTLPTSRTDPVTVILTASNLCGPSTITVKITPPATP